MNLKKQEKLSDQIEQATFLTEKFLKEKNKCSKFSEEELLALDSLTAFFNQRLLELKNKNHFTMDDLYDKFPEKELMEIISFFGRKIEENDK